ncbi:toxin Cry1Ac domain D-VI-related protein [Peribacillus sp. NPDC097895]|uniref:toxin Cry1Ac domain D-VI-related protein n=1 Tax=Peribacillus sp. NPDC097895 TaxID=3390619 RepID=UPI003CFF6C28
MKNSKVLKPINVMTTSFLLASSLLMPSAGFAEELSKPDKDVTNAQESEMKNQGVHAQTKENQSPSKAATAMMANATVVNNFQALKIALEADNGITTVQLGQNIDISGAIKIHPAKSEIVIEGNNHTISETGANGSSGGMYANGNLIKSITVKNVNIKGKNYYGLITIHDVSKNVEQIFENVNYSGPQLIWNRNGNVIFKGINDIFINDNTMPGSSPAQELAETGSVEIDGETKISHNNGHALIRSDTKEPQFKIAPNANVEINTLQSGDGIFYATGGDIDFSVGSNAKVKVDGKKGITKTGKFKSFNVDSNADVQMNRTGTDSYPMVSLYGPANINSQAKLQITTEDGHALEVENKVSNIDFKNPENVILSSIKKQAINNLSTSLTMSMDTGVVKLWKDAAQTPTNKYVSKDGGNFTWNAFYRYDVAQTIDGSLNQPIRFNIEFGKTKKIEIGKSEDGQAEKDLADAKKKVEDLFTDNKFDTLKDTTNQAAIDEAQDAVNKLPAGPEKDRLQDLVDNAKDLLKKKEQADKDLADAKKKVEELFTDNKFDTLKDTTDQAAVDEAQDAVNKLPAGPEKDRLQDLVDNAKDLLKKKEQAENDLNDAKKKVEDLFTNDKFDTLKDTTNQAAIDEAQDAVNKLPAGPEKDRLQDLVDNAKDLLKKKEQAEKDLNDAKKKVEDLFTDNKFDTLKDTTNQAAIDEAQDAVNKLPAGPEKDRLQDLVDNAKDLLKKKEQADKDLVDAKKKVENLFTDNKFDRLKDTTNQAAIDEAQDAVNKLPAGPEKDRLQDLVDNAKDLLKKKEQADKDLADAKKKVEDLFTNDKFDRLKDTTNQAAIDEAQDAVNKLPAGPEKDRLQDLVDNAKDLLKKKEQADKDLADAKKKVEDLFTDNKFDRLKDTTDQAAVDEAQDAVNKLPAGPEKDRLQDLVDKAEELLNKDVTPPAAPRLSTVTTASKEVTGTGEPDAKVTVTINGKTYTGVVGPDGRFKVDIPNQSVNTVITVTLTDAAGNVSERSTVTVTQFMPSEPVKLNTVYQNAEAITGTAPEGATIVRLLVNGVPLRTAPVNEDGSFSIYSKYVGVDENGNNKTLQPGDVITVDYGIRTPSNLQAHTTVLKEIEKLQVNSVAPNADYVTGKAPEGTQLLRLTVNGNPLRTVSTVQSGSGVINPDGSYQIYSRFITEDGVQRRLKAGDVIEVDYGPNVVGGDIAKTIVR